MATYIPEDKLLLPNDAFGQHIASAERFDDQLDWGILKEEAAKYWANIVLPYSDQVKAALPAVASLEFDMIGPSHGINGIGTRSLSGITPIIEIHMQKNFSYGILTLSD